MRKSLLVVFLLWLAMGLPTWRAAALPSSPDGPPGTEAVPAAPTGTGPKEGLRQTPGASSAVPQPPTPVDPRDALARDLDEIFAKTAPAKAVVAARVLMLRPDLPPKVLYSVRAGEPLIPASNMKVLVTAACWDRLGPDWSIRTLLGHLPPCSPGAPPDLAVIGGGDPTFSARFFDGDPVGALKRWARDLKVRGLTSMGRVLLDDGLFEATTVHPNWPPDQREDWYEAPASALNLNDNCVDVRVAAGTAGGPARVHLRPATAYVTVENRVATVADQKQHRISLDREVLETAVPGMRIRAGGGFWIKAGTFSAYRTVPDPTFFFGVVLAETLRAEGVKVQGPVLRADLVGSGGLDPRFVCDIDQTTRLALPVHVANTHSQGLYAECLLKILGAFGPNPDARYGAVATKDRPGLGSWTTGADEVGRWLRERDLPTLGCVLDDGSGLSAQNRLTAMCLSEVLAFMFQRRGEDWMHTFAQAGRTGSLQKRMIRTAADGRVWAKTGYIRGTSALSGYIQTRSGPVLVFSILMNDVPWGELWKARLAQDRACIRLVGYDDALPSSAVAGH